MASSSFLPHSSHFLSRKVVPGLLHRQVRCLASLKLSPVRLTDQRTQASHDDLPAAVKTLASARSAKHESTSVVEVFHCESIVLASLRMRRRVQLGIAMQVAGTQVSNFLFYSDWNAFMHAMNTFHFENSAALLAVSAFAIWKYHTFVRDAFIARHVTRIAIVPAVGSESLKPSEDAAVNSRLLLIETGPWQRRVTLAPAVATPSVGDEVAVPGRKIRLGRFLEMGVLHVDRGRGEILNKDVFEELLHDDLYVDKEEVVTDMAYAQHAFVSPDKIMPFLADAGVSESSEATEDSFTSKMEANPRYQQLCQISGRSIMDFYGYCALAMGVGAILVWIVPRGKG